MKQRVCLLAGFTVIWLAGEVGAQVLLGPRRAEGVALAPEHLPLPGKVVVGRRGLPPFRIAPPANLAARPKGATLTVDYLAAGEANIYGDVCVGWPAEARAAFTYAANIWGSYLNSDVPIVISASWANLGTGGVLGHAGARDFSRDFSGAPRSGTYYPIATANALAGTDLNGSGTEEIAAGFNAQFTDWYYGTDGNCPADKIDLVEVVLHEFCHGLGFLGSMSVSGGLGSWGSGSAYPFIYDRSAANGAGQSLLDTSLFPNGSVALYNQLVSGSVYFDGANAVSGNGGSRVALYAPSTWAAGSSYSHLDEVFNGTAHALMTYSADFGEAIHDPGAVILGLMKDVGWNPSSGSSSSVEPVIKANGSTNNITISQSDNLSITVQLNPGQNQGTAVDWWIVALANGSWYYLNNSSQWTSFDGNLSNCQPVYQGALFTLPSTQVLNFTGLTAGSYTFWFAVDYPMDGILNVNGLILYSSVTVTVQ